MALVVKETRLVVGSSDRQLRVWAIEHTDSEQEVDGATSRAVIGQKRTLLSDNGDTMTHDNVTWKNERNV